MDLCIYDEKFRRRPLDGQAQAHALSVSEPQWQYPGLMAGRPVNWPDEAWHEDYFPRDTDEDIYAEAHPYADSDRGPLTAHLVMARSTRVRFRMRPVNV